jgi:hypothetical protein
MSSRTLYNQVVEVTHAYLGPAAERFIARQVQNHLHKKPEQLSQKDLTNLIDWIQIAVSLLTEDSDIIEEYVRELRKLSKSSQAGGSAGR